MTDRHEQLDAAAAVRRKRLLFRSTHRGIKELDILLGGFAGRHLDALTAKQLDRYEGLLEEADPDLLAWVVGRRPVPAAIDHDVMTMLRAFCDSRHSRGD
ncbi:MAG: succinate dehydrogenase assembly factor 2 [Alphaproteobacteria bacterium]|nr:succinate dehydrogenase assembly factor 2 [Alphaproteobacteria bacterium]